MDVSCSVYLLRKFYREPNYQMITLFKELKKISRQLQGSENIFGYKSTVANQIFLLYCLIGNIYFTDQISKRVKFLWYISITCQCIISYIIGLSHFWYMYSHMHSVKSDLMVIFNVISAFGAIQVVVFGFPLISYLYRDRIEKMIQHVDDILTSSSNFDHSHSKQKQMIALAKENFRLFMGMYLIFVGVYLSVCCFDVALFFDEDKAKNFLYYAFPPPMIREYGSFTGYLIFNGILTCVFTILAFEVFSVLGLLLYWNTVCCEEIVSISHDLDVGMRSLESSQECWPVWEAEFEFVLLQCVKRFQNVTPLISYLKGFTEAIASFLTLAGFAFGVASLHVCLLKDLPLVLKLKYLTGYLITGIMIFLFYWIGQNLNNSVTEMSFSVYSTPWYESVKMRTHVHVFLCQTQSTTQFVIFKVYGLLLNNFSRYLHGVFSYANLLHKLTKV